MSGEPARREWPPFEQGHTLSTWHGGRSERRVGPLAAEIERAARAGPDWPPYLADGSYAPSVAAWARAEAQVQLLRDYLDGRDLADALTDVTESEETSGELPDGRRRKVSTSRRTGAALAFLDRCEGRAARLRAELGLTPLSRARLGRDVAVGRQADAALLLTQLREQAERGEGDQETEQGSGE